MKKIESQITQRMAKYLGLFRLNKDSLDSVTVVRWKANWTCSEFLLKIGSGTSLLVQWLRLCAPNEGGGGAEFDPWSGN